MTRHPCACSAEEFWGLREDPGWDQYNAELDGQDFTTLKKEVITEPNTGAEMVIRSHQLRAKVNPIPKALRSMLGSDEFKVVVQAQWYRLAYSWEDAMTLSVRPPVFPDRITIKGWQWTERIDEHNCNLCTKMEISVKIPGPGVGSQVEKGTLNGMKKAYADQPRRVLAYLAERKASGRAYEDPFLWHADRAAEADAANAAAKTDLSDAVAAAPAQLPVVMGLPQGGASAPPPFSSRQLSSTRRR